MNTKSIMSLLVYSIPAWACKLLLGNLCPIFILSSMFSFQQCFACKRRRGNDASDVFDPIGMDVAADVNRSGLDVNEAIGRMPMFLSPSNHTAALFAALQQWIIQCGLLSHLSLMEQCELPALPNVLLQIRLRGNPLRPDLDGSSHGRAYQGRLFHGTAMSHVPAILSAGCLLRCSVPTRGYHCIWSSTDHARALMYAPPVRIGNRAVVCIFGLTAGRVKSSHFKSKDSQLMLRECWHEITHLYILDFVPGQTLYRTSVPGLSSQLPQFRWSAAFENWNALPQPWVVCNGDNIVSVARLGLHDLPLP